MAASEDSEKSVEALIQMGAKINANTFRGNTPLHLAAFSGRSLNIKLLLDNGANIEAENDFGERPIHYALNPLNSDEERPLEYEKAIEMLIQNGARLDDKDFERQSPIHLAILSKEPSRVAMLVKYGASLKIRNEYGLTPLECALKTDDNLKCIKVLLFSGMDM